MSHTKIHLFWSLKKLQLQRIWHDWSIVPSYTSSLIMLVFYLERYPNTKKQQHASWALEQTTDRGWSTRNRERRGQGLCCHSVGKSLKTLCTSRSNLIQELALYSNFITTVHPNAFVSFSSLVFLHLSANELTSIPDLRSAPRCIELYLSSNNITRIENLQSLPDLEVLDLRANKIKRVENLSANKKLKR